MPLAAQKGEYDMVKGYGRPEFLLERHMLWRLKLSVSYPHNTPFFAV